MKLLIYLLSFYYLPNSCILNKGINQEMEGVYASPYYKIELHSDNEFIILKNKVKGLITTCDTISFGKWRKQSNQLIKLNSAPEFNSNIVFIDSIEQIQKNSPDSIYIEIKTPIEEDYLHQDLLKYDLVINYVGESDINRNLQNTYNIFVFSKPFSKLKLYSAFLEIYYTKPLYSYKGEYLGLTSVIVDEFDFPQGKGNYYIINLSELNRCYFEYARLNESIVEIKNNTLFWRGETFVREK